MLLKDKVAVVYGASGHIGGATARAFAREGATVYLTGRNLEKLQTLAAEIRQAGGQAEAAVVDALDPAAIELHLDAVLGQSGRVDISFNAVSIRGDLQGTPLVRMTPENFTLPVWTGAQTHFLTATAAARRMLPRGAGVILTLSSSSSGLSGRDRRFHLTGGFGVACATIEAFTRSLAGEIGPQGIRVVCLRSDAIPETWGPGGDDVKAYMEGGTVLGRLPTLAEVANAAAFYASDRASASTGVTINLTCGSMMD